MINFIDIKSNMPVICAQNSQIAVVEQMQGANTIKLSKDKHGLHHYIPLQWVSGIKDGSIQLRLSAEETLQRWSTSPPLC